MGGNSKGRNGYEFRTVWRVAGTPHEVMDVLGDAGSLARWWPSVYLSVLPLESGGPDGVGKAFFLHTKGWLPYTLKWKLTVTEPITEQGLALSAQGDLNGTGRWTFKQDGPETVVTYDWRVSPSKPLLRRLGWLLKPAFSANHRWAMARGQEGLALELRRRRPGADLSDIPQPAGPTFVSRRRRRKTAHLPL
ncbi:polyketide cyclase/dehydrase/lipid transport protein [Arthrobacter sp. SLBN-112]|uniref:SRPBCC family protein n=1 Tax=Arthrobacter sp. SLBN-112 TaxID=2768452 RepID=UPI001153F986|nr:SRPBCC family protein [Arthrobacter sp. SLBN-112]TQJ38050.1 polyketide cyclase/dehydrase/lipid transport protein [Arthrobacter sp. SLBN-112]